MKTKKIAERAKKTKPGKKDEKALSEKKGSGKVLGAAAEKDSDISKHKQAEEALRESEEKFRKIFEGHAAVKLLIEPESGAIIDANKAAEQYYGWTRAELKCMHIQQINTLPAEQVKIEMKKAQQQKCVHFEFRHRRADGSIREVEVFSSKIEMAGKDILYSIIHDITERKQAESEREAALAALRESEEKYRTLFTSSSDAIMLIEPISGKFISGNQTMMAMFGLKNDDDFSSFGPWDFSPERQPDERASAEKAKEMNEIAMRDGSNFFEWAHKRLNGEEFSTNVRLTKMVLDKKTILQATVRDITERKHAEEEIKMLATALKRINECVSITDVENTILFVNEAFLKTYGYSEQELIGQNIKIVRPPNSPQKVFEEVLPGTLSGGWTGELINRRKDSSEFPIFLSTTIIEKKDGKPNCLIGIAIDITERKQVESQKNAALEALQRSEENFRHSLDDSPLGVRIVTTKGKTIYANKVLLDLYGYANAQELNKIPIKERYTPQSYAESQLRKKARDQGDFGPSDYEINIVRKNGEIRHLLVLRKEVLWNGIKKSQVIYQDITERKRAESEMEDALAALRKSEEKFRKIFEEHAAVKLLIEPESGAIIDANKAAEQYYGWTRAELKRMHIQQLNTLPAEQVKIEMKKAQQQKCVHFEFRHRLADGSIRDVEVFSSKIEMVGKDILHSIIHDITDRKLAEFQKEAALEALQVSEEKLNEAQALGQIGNWEFDINTQKITWSKQVYKLYERDPVLGPPTTEEEAAYYSPEQGQILRGYTRNAIETGQFFEYDLQATLPSGKQVYLTARLRPIKDAQGHVIKLFGIVQDITERKQAESQREAALESLRESESRIKSISNNFTAGMIYQVVINPDGNRKFTYLSDSVQQLYGISPEEGMADATLIYSRVHEDDLELLTKDEDEAVKTFSTFKTDARMKDPSGKIRWSSFVSTPKMMADGSICFDGIEFIITERKLAEEALTKSEEKFRKAFYTSPDSVAITRLEDGMYLSINPGFTKITGYTEEDIFGKTTIGDNIWDNIEDRQRLVAGLKKHGEVTNLEAAFRMKDGNIRYGLMSVSIIDLAGVPHFLSITRDITERKRAETQREAALKTLRQTEENFRHSLDESPLGVRIVTAKSETIYANRALLDFCYYDSVAELNQTSLRERYTPESYEEYKKRRKARERGRLGPSEYEVSIVRKNGDVRQLQVFRKAIIWNGERQFQELYRDISESKQWLEKFSEFEKTIQGQKMLLDQQTASVEELIERLTRSREELGASYRELKAKKDDLVHSEKLAFTGRIAAGIAHEIRNPLTNVILSLRQLKKGEKIKPEILKYAEIMERNTSRIEYLITELLNCARPLKLNFQPGDIHLLIQDILNIHNVRLKTQKIKVLQNLTSQPSILLFDKEQLGRVFLNLIANAIDAMRKGGKLSIATKSEKKKFLIKIQDSGCGIPEKNLIKVFDPFFSTKKGGAGLGLSICQNIVASHGGLIEVESVWRKGSAFSVSLPFEPKPLDRKENMAGEP